MSESVTKILMYFNINSFNLFKNLVYFLAYSFINSKIQKTYKVFDLHFIIYLCDLLNSLLFKLELFQNLSKKSNEARIL